MPDWSIKILTDIFELLKFRLLRNSVRIGKNSREGGWSKVIGGFRVPITVRCNRWL